MFQFEDRAMTWTRVDQHESQVGWKRLPVGKISGQDGGGVGVLLFVNCISARKDSGAGLYRGTIG